MRTHVALLRGVNVGGRTLAMADLRELAASLGYREVATYVQSGNLVFASPERDPGAVAGTLEAAIAARFGVGVGVVVLGRDDLAAVAAGDPFGHEADPRRVHVLFRAEPVTPAVRAAVAAAVARAREKGRRDDAVVVGRHVHLWTPDGFGRSDLAAQLTRPGAVGGTATARNRTTVAKLLALLDG